LTRTSADEANLGHRFQGPQQLQDEVEKKVKAARVEVKEEE
jgi:hypothetical protein